MPRYDYQCVCGRIFEADQAIVRRHDAPPCPRCGGASVLVVSAPMPIFKGKGWTSPTTQDKLRRRAAEHAARGHRLPLKPTYRVGLPDRPPR